MDDLDLEQLVDWRNGLINPRIFTDQKIYERELEQVFGRSWLLLAHASQIPNPGDYFASRIGVDRVIVVRQNDGTVAAFFDYCKHRGMRICRSDRGNAKNFMCPYHGWTYDTAGRLVSVPNAEDGYYGELDQSQWGLQPLPQVTEHLGFVFGCLDPAAPSFVDHLGELAGLYESIASRLEGGLEVVGVQKVVMPANWKVIAEQFTGDSYHGNATHASFNALAAALSAENAGVDGAGLDALMHVSARQVYTRFGHGWMFTRGMFRWTVENLWGGGPVTEFFDDALQQMVARLGEARTNAAFTNTLLFPSLPIGASALISARALHPISPTETEVWEFRLVDAAAPPVVKRQLTQLSQRIYGPTGLVEPDDASCWVAITDNLATGRQIRNYPLNYQMGLGVAATGSDDAEYPGQVNGQFFGEMPIRQFYRRWLEFMTSEQWPHPEPSELRWLSAAGATPA